MFIYIAFLDSANMSSRDNTKTQPRLLQKREWALYDWYDSVNIHENGNLIAHLSVMKLFMRLSASL